MIGSDTAPFELQINVRTLPKKGQNVPYLADEAVRKEIAKAFDLISVEKFKAHAVLSPWRKDGVKLVGTVEADITQPCAVSFEPLPSKVIEDVEVVFVPDGSKLAKPPRVDDGELIFDPEGDDLPETFFGDSIDVAKVWLEFFTLGIDVFAKKEGVEFESYSSDGSAADEKVSPFAALAALKKSGDSSD